MRKTAVICALIIAIGAASSAGAAKLITGGQIKNGSIRLVDLSRSARRALRGRAGPAGQRGAAGPAGAQGPAGAAGPAGPSGVSSSEEVAGSRVAMAATGDPAANNVQSSTATCPAGTVVVGGGWESGVRTFIGVARMSGNGYFVIGINTSTLTADLTAKAICARGGGAVAAAASRRSSVDIATRLRDLRAAEKRLR